MKYISFSIYGGDAKYCVGAAKNVHLAKHWYPDWKCIFWVADDVPSEVSHYLIAHGAIVNRVGPDLKMGGMFPRFLAYDLQDCERFIVRDTDSRISEREVTLVRLWEESGKPFHLVRDHPHHITEISGGMWGCTKGVLKDSMRSLIDKWNGVKEGYDADQQFLKQVIWPIVNKTALQHDSCTRHLWPEATPIPVPLSYNNPRFCSEVFDHLDRPRAYDWELMLMKVEPVVPASTKVPPPQKIESVHGPLFIRPHLGLGDALIVNGLVRAKAAIHSEVIFPAKKQNMATVEEMFADVPNVKVVEVDDDEDATEMALKFQGERLALGMFSPGWPGTKHGWDKLMYEQAGVPWEQRWDGFRVPPCHHHAPLNTYAVVHDDAARKFTIPRTRLPKLPLLWVGPSDTLFNYTQAISEATEIHCMESCVAILADSIPTVAKRLVIHAYTRDSVAPIYRKDWKILSK